MYQTSDEYKELVYQDSTRHLLKIYIEEQEVNPNHIFDFKVSHTLFSNDEFTFGSVTAKSIEFRIHKDSLPETYNNFYVETGIGNEIVPIGYFILESIGKEDDDTITITAIDYMVKFEFNYDGSKLTFPVTMLEVLQDICSKAGVECGSTSFLNDDKTIAVYDNTVSAREYLSYIAEQAGGFACIGRDGKLYIRTIGQDTSEVDIKYFQNFTWGEQFRVSRVVYEDGVQDFKVTGKNVSVDFINSQSVQMIDEIPLYRFSDNIYNTIWINSDNMYIVNKEQIENIYNYYQNFNCYSFEGATIIDPAIDVGDIIQIDNKKVIYQGEMEYVGKFKANISSKIQAQSKEETMATKVSDKVKIRRVQSSINQIKGEIKTLVKEVDENSEKMTEVIQTVDEINQKVQNVAGLTDEINGTTSITLENCMEGNLLELRIYGNNTVFGGLYPRKGLYPSKGLYPRKATSLIEVTDENGNVTTYDLNIKPVLRQNGEYYDEFVIKDGKAYVIRRITLNDDGSVTINELGTIEDEREFAIPLSEGNNTIQILNYSANMYAKWVIQNDYTDVFATKIEMNSEISQTAEEIKEEVSKEITTATGELEKSIGEISVKADEINEQVTTKVGNEEIIAKLNIAVKDKQGIVELIGNIVKIVSDNFTLDENGRITAKSGTIAGWNISDKAIFKNYANNTYQCGMYSTDSSEYFIYAGAPVGGLLSESSLKIHKNGDMYSRNLNMLGDGALKIFDNEGILQFQFTKDNIIRYNNEAKTKKWITEGRGYENGSAVSHTLWLGDSQKYVIQDEPHAKVLFVVNRYGDEASPAVPYSYFFTHLSIGSKTDNRYLFLNGYQITANTSDERLKKNIVDSEIKALKLINKIHHKSFDWNEEKAYKEGHVDIGYIAQELIEIDENFVIYNKEFDTYQIDVLYVLATATKAIQEISNKQDEFENRINKLEGENTDLKLIIEDLTKRIEKLEKGE